MILRDFFKSYFLNNYGYIAFSILAIFSIPTTFYLFNAKEFNYDIYLFFVPVVVSIIVLIIGLVVSLLGHLFFKNFARFNQPVQLILVALGLIVFINDFMVPTQARHLDGTIIDIPEPMLLSFIELGVSLIVLFVLLLSFNNTKIQRFFISVSRYALVFFLFLSLAVAYTSTNLNLDTPLKKGIENSHLSAFNKKLPNIYFLWLDSMQTDYFLKGVDELGFSEDFAGFTVFEHNMSNYLYTMRSSKSFMNGTLYKGGDYDKWYGKDTLRETLRENGYNLTSYGMGHYVSTLDHNTTLIEDILADDLAVRHPYFKDFVTLSLVRMAPNFLANETNSVAGALAEKINPLVNPSQKNLDVDSVEKGMYVYATTKTYDKSTADEFKRKSYGEFVLKQIILPHAPYVLDEDCKYVGLRDLNRKLSGNKKYYQQVSCALKLVNQFFISLKKLDRFENSLIIVMGDHGDGRSINSKYKSKVSVNKAFTSWNKDKILDRMSALLMIKPPGQSSFSSLQVSSKETQHIDIVPTIFNILNWPVPDNIDGRDIFSHESQERKSLLTYYKPEHSVNWDTAEIYQVDYDPVKGRTDLKYLDLLKNYFSQTIKN